jgi:hypothetical protein
MGIDTAPMASKRDAVGPLASFVLRVCGRPVTLRYELHNVRTGEKRRFTRADALAAFLRQQGVAEENLPLDDPANDTNA